MTNLDLTNATAVTLDDAPDGISINRWTMAPDDRVYFNGFEFDAYLDLLRGRAVAEKEGVAAWHRVNRDERTITVGIGDDELTLGVDGIRLPGCTVDVELLEEGDRVELDDGTVATVTGVDEDAWPAFAPGEAMALDNGDSLDPTGEIKLADEQADEECDEDDDGDGSDDSGDEPEIVTDGGSTAPVDIRLPDEDGTTVTLHLGDRVRFDPTPGNPDSEPVVAEVVDFDAAHEHAGLRDGEGNTRYLPEYVLDEFNAVVVEADADSRRDEAAEGDVEATSDAADWTSLAHSLASHGVPQRRAEVVALVATGHSHSETADELGLENRANVATHVRRYRNERDNAIWLAENGPGV